MTAERRLVYWLLVVLAVGTIVYLLRAALLPFIAGMAVAYLLDPLADRMERVGVPRTLAALSIILVFVVLVVGALVILVPILSAQITDLIGRLPAYVDQLRESVAPLLRRLRASLTPAQAAQVDDLVRSHVGDVVGWIGRVAAGILSGGAALLNLLGLILIMPVVAFYLVRDWDRIVAYLDSLLPERGGETVRHLAREIDDRLSGFVRGQAIVILLLGAWYATGLTLIGLDFGILVGVAAGLLSIIPFVGNLVGLGASLGLAFAQFNDWLPIALVVGVFVSGQVLEGNFVTPKIVGDRVGLHPVWLLFAVTAGASLLGITGALLAVPVAAAFGVIVRYLVQRYRDSALFADQATVPVAEAENGRTP